MKYGRLLATTIVGSCPQPHWLVDHANLRSRLPPRVRARELWRVPEPYLKQAQDDACQLTIWRLERTGLDILGDGEIRRESYSNRLATALAGIDADNPGSAIDRTGKSNPVPRVVGSVRRVAPIELADAQFLRLQTSRKIKVALPGPFTMTQQAQDDYYHDDAALALDYAAALNEEIVELYRAGVDIVQLDEPYMQARPEAARRYAIRAINRAFAGTEGIRAVHICFGYAHVQGGRTKPSGYDFLPELADSEVDLVSIEAAQPALDLSILESLRSKDIMLGVLDLNERTVEPPDLIADRIRAALEYVAAERLVIAPDCGMKYLDRKVAYGKLEAMVAGATIVRRELCG